MRQWLLAGTGVAMIVAAGAIALRGRPTPAPPAPSRATAANPLLYVQHDGEALRLHWKADASEVRSARSGALVVVDGGRESRMELRPQELRSGVASWWPHSKEVTFRLELDGAPAGSMRASAQKNEEKPSAFEPAVQPRKRGVAVKRVQPVAAPVEVEPPPKRGSKIGRAFGKIPLLRRFKRHRD
jgi:hypothetical protein